MPTKDAAWWRAYRAQKKKVDVDHFEVGIAGKKKILVPAQVVEAKPTSPRQNGAGKSAAAQIRQQAQEISALRDEVKMLKRKLAEKPVELVSQPLQWLPSDNPPTLKPWHSDLELDQFRTRPFTPVPKVKDKKAKA